jgi:hypothetical protein
MSEFERFGVVHAESVIDVEHVIDRARALWRRASGKVPTAQVELYAKASSRIRVSQRSSAEDVELQLVRETGHALRVMPRGANRAAFAASSGWSNSALDWTLEAAMESGPQRPALVPRGADVPAERFDLDAQAVIPSEDALRSALLRRPFLRSIEAGTTLETLIGADGWVAVRRRHRLWGVADTPRVRLVAQRGFERWEDCFDLPNEVSQSAPIAGRRQTLTLSNDAAGPVVSALVDQFHGPSANQKPRVGPGWEIADDPRYSDGLSGGTFDDSGFPTTRRVLAEGAVWVGRLAGPGTLWRSSFRNSPVESASNLVMASSDAGGDPAPTTHARVIRMSPTLWVLELDTSVGRKWLRVDPRWLLAACSHRMGVTVVSSAGPIVPALRFEGVKVS